MFELILKDLKEKFGSKVLLDPTDLVNEIGISTGQQANLRSEGKFPIPYTKDNGRIKVSIYALAQYLARISEPVIVEQLKKIPNLDRTAKKKQRGNLEKIWWLSFKPIVVACIQKTDLTDTFKVSIKSNQIQM